MKVYDEQQSMEYVYDKIQTNDWYVLVDPKLPNFEVLDRMKFIEEKYYTKHNEDFEIVFDPRKWTIFLFKKNRITPDELNAVIEGNQRDDKQDIILPIPMGTETMPVVHIDFMMAMNDVITARKTK